MVILSLQLHIKRLYQLLMLYLFALELQQQRMEVQTLDYVFSAVNEIIENAEKDFILVQKSTVPVRTAREIERMISDKNSKNLKVNILSTPEFLREGSAIFDTLFFDRVVVGGDFDSAKKIVEIYRNVDNFSKNLNIEDFHDYAFLNISPKYVQNMPAFEDRVVMTDIESAELIKVTANSFLALKIAFANTVARICDKTGADSRSVFDGVGMDNRIGRAFLYPGLGYGGDCFPKDVAGMIDTASSFDVNFGILHEVVNVNKTQTYFVIDKIKKMIGVNDLHGKVITILGLAFKAGTSDVRKSPSIRLIEKLLKQGAIIKAFDPRATENAKIVLKNKRVEYFDNIEEACATEWKELIDFDYLKVRERLINPMFLDGKGVLNLAKMQGFKIERI